MTLNAEGVRSPRAREGRHRSWAKSSLRTVLFNPLYKGEVLWGRTNKRARGAAARCFRLSDAQ